MLQQDKLAGLSGLVDLASVDLLELEVSAGTQAPDKALLAAVQHLVETLEPLHSLGPLVSPAHAALLWVCLVQLPVVVAYCPHLVNMVYLRDIGHTLDAKPIAAHGDRQGVVGMALGQLQQLFPGSLGDIALRLCHRHWEFFPQPAHKGLAHDTHKGRVPGRFAAPLFEFVIGEPSSVEVLVALVTDGH